MAGAQSYYHHAGDFRNGSAGDGLPPCVGESVANNYSTLLYASEAGRIVRWHAQTQVIPPVPSSFALLRPYLAHFFPVFLVFCAFSPSRRDGSNEPQAGTQGQDTAV